jgi:2-polyprenyl-3-methyl-5-hydroxy-6-metoxy-1,4-benzoquinol methylase
MDVTERLSLETVSEHTVIACEHVQRYEFAASLSDGVRVVDLCCGTGYGSAILAGQAKEVQGVDNDVATIETAMRTVNCDRPIGFVASDAAAYLRGCEPGDIDVIVCFEGLEHVSNLDKVVEELARLGAGGVKLVVSVPNSATWHERNPYHVTEFSFGRARELFDRLGSDMLLAQNVAEGSLIVDPHDPGTHAGPEMRWPERVEAEYANHFIGLVNFDVEQVRAVLSARIGLSYAPTYNRHIRNIEVANMELWRTNARLGRSAFAHSGSAAAARSKREEWRSEEQAAKIAELSARVQELTETLRIRDEILQRYISAAQRRAARPTRRLAQAVARTVVRATGRAEDGRR